MSGNYRPHQTLGDEAQDIVRAFLTGGSGFLGRHLIDALHDAGISIEAVSRAAPPNDRSGVKWRPAPVDWNTDQLGEAMRGCDVVVHMAARAHKIDHLNEQTWPLLSKANIELTETVFQAAEAARVKQFIFISSIGAVCSFSEAVVDEFTPPSPDTKYGISKRQAEIRLESLAINSSLALTIIRPCLMYGRGNPGNMASLARLIDIGIPLPLASIKNRKSFVYVGSVVKLIEAALLNASSYGQLFTAADDEWVSTPELCLAIATARGTRIRLWHLPIPLLRAAGHIGDAGAFFSRQNPLLGTYSIDRLVGSLPCSNARAKQILGWKPVLPFREAIASVFSAAQ